MNAQRRAAPSQPGSPAPEQAPSSGASTSKQRKTPGHAASTALNWNSLQIWTPPGCLEQSCPLLSPRTWLALGSPAEQGAAGDSSSAGFARPPRSPKLLAPCNGSVNPPVTPANTYHSSKINGHQWMASQEEVI